MKNKLAIILIAGLAPMGWSAGLENLRAPQLADIKAGEVTQLAPAIFQQPELVKLDMCVLSEMKNNKCYFKCESGAIAIEPAVRPDFSSGEPAGPCLPYITRQIKVSGPAAEKYVTSNQLDDLLKDPSPEVRKAAVRSAKNQIQNGYTQDRVLTIFKNRNERLDIRVEAARTLSYSPGNYRVQDELKGLLKYVGHEPQDLRVITYKALWSAAPVNSSIQDFLIDAVKNSEKDQAARRAAIWALFSVSNYSGPKDVLVNVLRSANEDEATRIEAIKSLYSGLTSQYRAVDLMKELVRDIREKRPVRLAALKALSGASNDSSVQSFLEDIVRNERDQDLRAAAVDAMSPDMTSLREFFHLPYKLEHGFIVSPIEAE